jgi:hypothetical protein
MALGDDVKRLHRNVDTLLERVANLRLIVRAVQGGNSKNSRAVVALRQEVALMQREIEELKSWKADQKKQQEEWGRRLWAFGPNLLAAVVGGLIAATIAYFIPRH